MRKLHKRAVITPIIRTGVVEFFTHNSDGTAYQLIVHRADYDAWIAGKSASEAFASRTRAEQTFIVTGITPRDQAALDGAYGDKPASNSAADEIAAEPTPNAGAEGAHAVALPDQPRG